MIIKHYVRNVLISVKLHQKVAILCCVCLVGIVILSTNTGHTFKVHKEKDSYILYRMKELKFGKLKSAFDIKIYTATSNSLNSLEQSSTPQGLTTTKTNIISETPSSYLTVKSEKHDAPGSNTSQLISNYSVQENKSASNFHKNVTSPYVKNRSYKQRVPLIDNTAHFRVSINNGTNGERKLKHDNTSANQISYETISKILTEKDNLNQTLILLVTYLRSGSTFTADLIQQASNVFYVYEPLKPYVRGQHYFTLDSVCHIINGTCRKQTGRRENIDHILDDVAKFYNCDLFHVPIYYFRYSNKSSTMLDFDYCRHHKTQYKCLLEFQDKCRQSVRMIKAIRLNLDVAEKLMEEFPRLKVIHLIRDPRGSYQSRKNGYFMNNQKNLEAISKSNCDSLNADLRTGFRLKEAYPDRIKTLLYERVAEEPLKAARSLFRFLELTEPAYFESWLENHTKAARSNGYYDTIRKNSKTTAYLWRKFINLRVVKSFDKNCRSVYRILGFKPFNNYKALQNISIPSRQNSPIFGDFLD